MRCITFFLSVLLCWGISIETQSVPAYPRKVAVRLEDGSEVGIVLKGDEHCKWALTEDDYTLLPSGDGWVFAQVSPEGKAVVSAYKLCADNERMPDLEAFLATQPKNIRPERNRLPHHGKRLSSGAISSLVRPATGDRKALVILMSFPDREFVKAHADFDALFNQPGYGEDGAQGSVYDYFLEASYGQLSLQSDVVGPFCASRRMSYYGGNGINGSDQNPYALFLEAMEYASQVVELSDYDANGDGYVDNIHIVFAGYGEEAGASPNAIWSHESSFQAITVQGMKIDRYSCTPELRGNNGSGISRIGACCHEMGHALGAMDYYDTDYASGGSFNGTGDWDIMASGSWNNEGITPAHFNPYVMVYDFGWTEVGEINVVGEYELFSSTLYNSEIYRVDTSSEGDFYLLEYRCREGFDCGIPGEGLMVYHVHPGIESVAHSNVINATAPQYLYPVCASSSVSSPSSSSQSYGDINTPGCPFPGTSGKTSFGPQTVPAAFCWDGREPGFEIRDIAIHPDGKVSFFWTSEAGGSEPSERWKTVWAESFEDESAAFSWRVSGEYGSSLDWQYAAVGQGNVPPSSLIMWNTITEAADGVHYMALENKSAFSSVTGMLASPQKVDTSKGQFKLSFSYQCRSRLGSSPVLEVYAKEGIGGREEQLQSINTMKSVWTKTEVLLPQRDEPLEIIFKADIDGIGGVYVDDVSVLHLQENTLVGDMYKGGVSEYSMGEGRLWLTLSETSSVRICTLGGLYVYDGVLGEGRHELILPSGIYILETGKQVKKIRVN